MLASRLEQPVERQVPQPQAEGHGRMLQVPAQASYRFEVGFLYDIGRIDAPPQFGVEAHLDEAQQITPVARKELLEGSAVAPARLCEQAFGLDCVWPVPVHDVFSRY